MSPERLGAASTERGGAEGENGAVPHHLGTRRAASDVAAKFKVDEAFADEVPVGSDLGDAISNDLTTAASRRLRRWATAILVAWLLLAGSGCALLATELPAKSAAPPIVAVVALGLGVLLGVALIAERRAADRRLHGELAKASSMLRSIEAVTEPGLAFLGLDDLFMAVLERTKEAVGADLAAVLLPDANDSTLRVRASIGSTQFAPLGSVVELDDGLLGMVSSWGRPVVVADVRDAGVGSLPDWQQGISSLMAAPLIVLGTTLGTVEVASVEPRTFSAADRRLLQVVADRLAAVVERARLDDVATRHRFGADHANLQLRLLARGGVALAKALVDYEGAMDELAGVVVPEFADWFAVDVLEESGEARRVVTRAAPADAGGRRLARLPHPHPAGQELVRQAMAQHRAQVLMPTARLDPESLAATVHSEESLGECADVSSMLVVPVEVRGAFMAALSFARGPARRGYRPSDLETARELAKRVAVAIERVLSWGAAQRAGEAAARYAERLRSLVDASLVVNSQSAEAEVLQLLAEHTQRALGADVAIVSARPLGGPVDEVVWPSARQVGNEVRDDLRDAVVAASSLVARSGDVVRRPTEPGGTLPHVLTEPVNGDTAGTTDCAVRGWVAAPITDTRGEVRRVVVAAATRGARFSFEDESVLALLAQMATVALRNARLYEEVVDNEQRLQTVVDSSPLAIAEVATTGEAQWWNPAAADLFGWPDQSVPRRIPVRAGSELVLSGLLESAATDGPITGVTLPVAASDGETRELSISASPLGTADTVTGVLVVAEDVTGRQQMLEQFHQAERLHSMSRMAGALAHDFNNLLTVIVGCSDVLMRRLVDDDVLGRDVAAIQRAGARAALLTSQLVRIGGTRHPVLPEVIGVDEAILAMAPMLTGVLGDRVRLKIVGGAGEAAVRIDPSELERAVLDLAINARDAMPTGGTFVVHTMRSCAQPGDVEVVELSIADTGTGMDEETASHCFEPFFTTKGRARGTGLGLAAVRAIVTQADGDVRVASSPGNGARFTITLPLCDGAPSAATPCAPSDVGAAVAPRRTGASIEGKALLVVDDEPEVLRLEVRELQAAGYDVVGASNAREALSLLTGRGGAIDLLVTDVVMPGMNGIELASAVHARWRDIAVLFVSGHLDDDTASAGSLPAHASLLTKPFAPEELSAAVRASLEGAPARS